MKERNLDNYFIVNTRGFSCTWTTIFNIVTHDIQTHMTWDIDNEWVENANIDIISLPNAPKEVKDLYEHLMGVIKVGDLVQIVSGRKFKGEFKRVSKMFEYRINKYYSVPYLVFEDGTKVNEFNCKLVQELERYQLF